MIDSNTLPLYLSVSPLHLVACLCCLIYWPQRVPILRVFIKLADGGLYPNWTWITIQSCFSLHLLWHHDPVAAEPLFKLWKVYVHLTSPGEPCLFLAATLNDSTSWAYVFSPFSAAIYTQLIWRVAKKLFTSFNVVGFRNCWMRTCG